MSLYEFMLKECEEIKEKDIKDLFPHKYYRYLAYLKWSAFYEDKDKEKSEHYKKKAEETLKEAEKQKEEKYKKCIEEASKYKREFIDIDEETGKDIYYLPAEQKYQVENKLYTTLEITVNYTFETSPREPDPARNLEGEVKITVRVQKCNRKCVDVLVNKLYEAFKRYMIDEFSPVFTWYYDLSHARTIAEGLMIKTSAKKAKIQRETGKPIKTGAFFRVSNEPPTIDPETRTASAEVFGEFVRGRGTHRERHYTWRFDLNEYFDWEQFIRALE